MPKICFQRSDYLYDDVTKQIVVMKKDLITAFSGSLADILSHFAVFFRILIEFLFTTRGTEIVIPAFIPASVL